MASLKSGWPACTNSPRFDVSGQHGAGERAPYPAPRRACRRSRRPAPRAPRPPAAPGPRAALGPGQLLRARPGHPARPDRPAAPSPRPVEQALGASQLPVGDAALHLERRDVRARLAGAGRRRGSPCHQRLALEHEGNGVHHAEHRVPGDPVSFLQAEGQEPAADLRGDGHLRRLEVAVGVGPARRRTRPGRERRERGSLMAYRSQWWR